MAGKKYLIDTNTAIDYIGDSLLPKALKLIDNIIDNQYYFSIINEIELLGFSGISKNEENKFQELLAMRMF